MRDEAVAVVTASLSDVEHYVRQVETWPTFLPGLESVRQTSHLRYVLTVRQQSRTFEVPICLSLHPREHEVCWHVLNGPAWNGTIRMRPVDADQHTRVQMELTVDPRSFMGHLSEMFGSSHSQAKLALQHLQDAMTGARTAPA